MVRRVWSKLLLLALVLALGPVAARAELAVSANDNKAVLENGAIVTVPNAGPDTVSLIDLSAAPPRLLAEIEAPATVVGPPGSVAVAPDESFALVTGGMKLDPSDPKKLAPDDKLSVIDLKAQPPRVVQTFAAGPCWPQRKMAVFGMLEREGELRATPVADLKVRTSKALSQATSSPPRPS